MGGGCAWGSSCRAVMGGWWKGVWVGERGREREEEGESDGWRGGKGEKVESCDIHVIQKVGSFPIVDDDEVKLVFFISSNVECLDVCLVSVIGL